MTDTQTTQPQPHPFVLEAVLYVSGIPQTISETELAQAFQECLPVRPKIAKDGVLVDGGAHGRIEFRFKESGELTPFLSAKYQLPHPS